MRRKKHRLEGIGGVACFPSNRRKYIGVFFECCSVYTRVYINKKKTAYIGWCPRCAQMIEIRIDKRGTNSRFFKATRH